jgi:hypothetical protein
MDTSTIVFVVIGVVVIGAGALMLRSNLQAANQKVVTSGSKPRPTDKPRPLIKDRYRATSIICGDNSCVAVQAFSKKRFLVVDNDVPQLPVPNCDVKKCACIYAHHEDRREEDDDRRGPRGLRSELHSHVVGTDRRAKRGRRKSDWE